MSRVTLRQDFSGAYLPYGSAQTLANDSFDELTNWGSPEYDTDGFVLTSRANRFTIPVSLDGSYFQFSAVVEFAINANFNREMGFLIYDASNTYVRMWGFTAVKSSTNADSTVLCITTLPIKLNKGYSVACGAGQTSGGNLATANLWGASGFGVWVV